MKKNSIILAIGLMASLVLLSRRSTDKKQVRLSLESARELIKENSGTTYDASHSFFVNSSNGGYYLLDLSWGIDGRMSQTKYVINESTFKTLKNEGIKEFSEDS